MRRFSLSAAVLLAVITGPLSGCAHTGSGMFASRGHKMEAKYDMARLAESEGQLDKARESYEAIYKKDPSIAEVSHRLGIVSAKQANYEDAKRYLNEARQLAPQNPEILNDLGYVHYLSGEPRLAESAYESALKLAKNDKRATNNLALVLGSQGKFEESFRMFRLVNSEAEAHSNVAYLYAQNGDGKKALEHYSRALTLNPEMKSAANAMLEIASMQQKLESDRAQIAQQQNRQAPVAQASAQAQPKVYQQLTAARSETATSAVTSAAPVAPVATPVAATAIAATAAPQVAASRSPSATKEEFEELATPAITVTATRPTLQPVAADFAEPVEAKTAQVVPTASAVAERAVKESEQIEQTSVVSQTATEKTDKVNKGLPELKPAEMSLAEAHSPQREIAATVAAEEPPTLANEFEEPAAVEQTAVITPVRSPQAAADVAEPVVPQARKVPTVDYVALCPDANDLVKPLLVQMNSQDSSQMKLALHKLGELMTDAKTAAPAVHVAMTSTDAYVRIHAALAAWRIEQNSVETIPIFEDGLKNADANVRSFAATALAMGPQVNEFVGPLTAALMDPNPFVRLHSAETLYKYPGQETAATKAMIGHLTNQDTNIRWLATFIMGETLPKSPDAVKALQVALRDTDYRIRAGAAFALGGLGSDAQAALPELRKLSTDLHPDVRRSVQDAIQSIEKPPVQARASR